MQRDGGHADSGADDVESIGRAIAKLTSEDLEFADPPTEIWERIDAELAADRDGLAVRRALPPRVPPDRSMWAGTVVEYRIDADDIVIDVGDGWESFARHNAAPELVVPASNRTIWTYIDRDATREIWQLLVGRVRTSQIEAQIPIRCDSPHARRWFEITVSPRADGHVHFRSVLAFAEPRPRVALLDPGVERDHAAEPVALCSWCGRGESGPLWLDIEDLLRARRLLERASMPDIAYGICGTCREDMSAELVTLGEIGGASA